MRPFRLALAHLAPDAAAGLAARLRGAAAEPCHDLAAPPACDAVLLGSPGPSFAATAARLLARRLPLLVVADPCPPWSAVAAAADAARQAAVPFALVSPDRYLPSRQLIACQLSALGEPGLIRLHRWSSPPGPPDALLRDLDAALWLMGRPPERVFAVAPASPVGHYTQVHLGFAGGAMALLDHTDRLPPGDGYTSLSVIAAGGAAYADDHANTHLLYRGGRAHALPADERAGQYAGLAQDFLDDLRAGRDPSAHTAAWREVYAAAGAVARSLAAGQAVTPEGP